MAILHRDALELTSGEPGNIQARLSGLLGQAPLAIAYLEGEDHRYKFVNDLYVQAAGRLHGNELIGLPVREALSELEGSGVFELLDEVYRSGLACRKQDYRVSLYQGGSGIQEDRYFDFTYDPMVAANGEVEGIFVLAVDMTERVANRRVLEQNEE